MKMHLTAARLGFLSLALMACTASQAQLRVAAWNVTNYSSGRISQFQTSLYGVYNGRQFAPDVILGQEFLSAASVANFKSILNTAPGSPADWEAAPFVDGPDTESVFFYRTSKVDYLGMRTVAVGGPDPNQPRNTYRYDVLLKGYSGEAAKIALYSVHMKAGDTGTDNARRLVESQRIRDDAEKLPAGWNFVIGGDFNMQSSNQTSYVELVGSQVNNLGRFFDPIASPGPWDNNSAFKYIHTQDPASTAGMDSRYDFLLVSGNLIDNRGLDYLGDATKAFSTTTWNDPNHSYRCWGNDGTTYNFPLNPATNTMVGPTIAQALRDSAVNQGHLPVYMDLLVPGKASVPTIVLDFGLVDQFSSAVKPIQVGNVANTSLWGPNGVAPLRYSFAGPNEVMLPGGTFQVAAGSSSVHSIRLNTNTSGWKSTSFSILTDDPDRPVINVVVNGVVVGLWNGNRRPVTRF